MAYEQALWTHTPVRLGDRLFDWLLGALTPPSRLTDGVPPPPLRLDFSLEGDDHGLTLRCDATAVAPPDSTGLPRPVALRGGGVLSIPSDGRPARGPLDDFLAALRQGPARGVVFRATSRPQAVFRGDIAGRAVRLSVCEMAPRGAAAK